MTKLNDTQLILLSTAAARENGSLIPLPPTIADAGATAANAIAALLKRGLAHSRFCADNVPFPPVGNSRFLKGASRPSPAKARIYAGLEAAAQQRCARFPGFWLKPGNCTSLIPREEKPPTLPIPPRQRILFEFGTAPTGAREFPAIQVTDRYQRALRATE